MRFSPFSNILSPTAGCICTWDIPEFGRGPLRTLSHRRPGGCGCCEGRAAGRPSVEADLLLPPDLVMVAPFTFAEVMQNRWCPVRLLAGGLKMLVKPVSAL